jgi:SAM-dependent methyltransferase
MGSDVNTQTRKLRWRWIVIGLPTVMILLTTLHFPRKTDPPLPPGKPAPAAAAEYRRFYEAAYAPKGTHYEGVQKSYGPRERSLNEHTELVRDFFRDYGLAQKQARVLEVGAGDGSLQDLVADYTGLDISEQARRFFHKPFVQGSATSLPFGDSEFDTVWTVYTLEHVPNPEQALREMRRVVKNGGLIYLLAAWYVGSWKADGYEDRPFGDFGWKGKLVKASVPIRRSVYYRSIYTFPIRFLRYSYATLFGGPTTFRYNPLQPNYTYHWGTADGDAVNDMDAYEAALWFTSRGDMCLSADSFRSRFFFRKGALVIQVHK